MNFIEVVQFMFGFVVLFTGAYFEFLEGDVCREC